MVKKLRNDDAGRYCVATATGSHYLLDLTARTLTRYTAETAAVQDCLGACSSRLRRDGEALELLMLESCAVGASARYWIQVRDDHLVTLRTTSPVVRIDALDTAEA